MVTLVMALAAVLLGELDAIALDMVDGTDMDAIGADDFHMFFDFAERDHDRVLVIGEHITRGPAIGSIRRKCAISPALR